MFIPYKKKNVTIFYDYIYIIAITFLLYEFKSMIMAL